MTFHRPRISASTLTFQSIPQQVRAPLATGSVVIAAVGLSAAIGFAAAIGLATTIGFAATIGLATAIGLAAAILRLIAGIDLRLQENLVERT